MIRVLITGASGYLGGRLVQSLSSRPDIKIDVAVREPNKLPKINILKDHVLTLSKGITVGDLASSLVGIDTIVHLLATNAQASGADPFAAVETTVGWTIRFLEAAKIAGVKRFIYLSTVHVYGSLHTVVSEETIPHPLHPYGITHRAAEDFVLAASGPEPVVVRLSNAVGAPATSSANCWMLAANDFCRQAVRTGVIKLLTPGHQHRDFIAITDVLSVLSRLIVDNNPPPRVMNLASGCNLSIRDLATLVAQRAKNLLDIPIRIEAPQVATDHPCLPGSISTDVLQNGGYLQMLSPLADEIDEILRFCSNYLDAG